MRLLLSRHGETHYNIQRITMGQGIDGDLNEQGIEQAKKLAARLKNEIIHHAYVSPLKRAVKTAGEILKFHPEANQIFSPEISERNLGVYEGRPNTEWKEIMRKSALSFNIFKPEGGESYQELYERVSNFFDNLTKQHPDETVLILSHTGALTMLLLKILNKPITRENYEKFKPENTALTIFEISGENEKPELIILNSTDHL